MAATAIREAYGRALEELGGLNGRVVALEADVGSSTMSKYFGAAFPDRYFNMGIAEIGMMSTAAGMAKAGLIPFVNTFAVFMATRASDPVQSLIAYDRLNVVMAGAYGGLSDSYDGASHHSISDMAFMRALPGVTVISPCDGIETRKAVMAASEANGPVYLRLSRAAVDDVTDPDAPFEIGRGVMLREGTDVTVIACGTSVHQALAASDMLLAKGISAGVADMHTVSPIDASLIIRMARKTGAIVTVEEHSVRGGLGSAVAEVLAENTTSPVRFKRVGLNSFAESAAYPQLLKKYGIDSAAVAEACESILG